MLCTPGLFDGFEDGEDGWTSTEGGLHTSGCGDRGSFLGGVGVLTTASSVNKTFDLSAFPHDELLISLDFIKIGAWTGEAANVYIDGIGVWSEFMSTDPGLTACASWTETVVPIEIRIDDVEDQVTLTVNTFRDSPLQAGLVESFGIDNVRITPILAGYFDRFNDGSDEWTSNDGEAQTSICGSLGQILGGAGIAAQGVWFEKLFDLAAMPHDELHIGLVFVAIDMWDNERADVMVDGVVAWSHSFTGALAPAPLCGGGSSDSVEDVFLTVSHYTASVTLRITTTLDSAATDEAFGIDDVRVLPVATGVDRAGYFENYNAVVENWATDGQPPSSSTCGGDAFGAILGGYTLSAPPAWLQKEFDLSVTPHNQIRVSMEFVSIDQWTGETAEVSVDRQVVWSAPNPGDGQNNNAQCQNTRGAQWTEARAAVDVTMEHHADVGLIRIAVGNSPSPVHHWGIDNFRLLPISHGWFDDFESPVELAQWTGSVTPIFTTHCGDPLNFILGGYGFSGQGAYLEREYDFLGKPHNIARVTFDFYKIDSWDGEAAVLLVNGAEEWRQTFTGAEGQALCGSTNPGWNEHVDVNAKHDGPMLTLRVMIELNSVATDESFGVDNVGVEPVCTTQIRYGADGVPLECLAVSIAPGVTPGGGH